MASRITLSAIAVATMLAVPAVAKDAGQFEPAKSKSVMIGIGSTADRQPAAAMPRTPAPKGMQGNTSGGLPSIEGPAWNYQTGKRGPKFEIAALGGGGIENAPFLAHVGMHWRF